jgi:type I restriction-modification system DNA methylase subunit/restriction endonuclease S subunit
MSAENKVKANIIKKKTTNVEVPEPIITEPQNEDIEQVEQVEPVKPVIKKKTIVGGITKRKSPKQTSNTSFDAIVNGDNNVVNENIESKDTKKEKAKPVRGAKKIKTAFDTSYLRLPEKDAVIDYSNTIKINKQIDNALESLHSKIKAMHQVLWEVEHMDGEQALDEIMKLMFLKYLGSLVTDKNEANKIDLFDKKYYTNILEDDDDIENFNIAKRYIENFNNIQDDINKARKDGKETTFLDTLFNPDPTKCDIFKTITKILANHPTTKGLYNHTNMLDIKDSKTLKELIKHINSSCVDDTKDIEDLIGEIYEYFLNKYNKKKSALGQFFTPRMLMNITIIFKMNRIKELMKKFANPIIADKCMGTGGWLVKLFNAFKDINKGILLHGREFKPNTYQYGIINLISTTGNYPYKPSLGCSLTNIEDFKIHLIISNPPFKGKFDYKKLKETYNKNKREGFNSSKFEDIFFLVDEDNTPLQFLQLYIHSLIEGGMCMIVLPYGELFFKDGKDMNVIRRQLLDKIDITDIILCPPGIFTHTDVKVCMLIFEKNKGGTKEIKFSKFQFNPSCELLQSIKHITTVKKADILKEPICSFYHMDYLLDENVSILKPKMAKYEWVPFGDVFDLVKGNIESTKIKEIEYENKNSVQLINWSLYDNIIKYIEYEKPLNGGLFISYAINGSGNISIRYTENKCIHSNIMYNLFQKNNNYKINLKYLSFYLKNIQLHIETYYCRGACNQSLDIKNFNRMEIPIPPLEDQLFINKQMEAANGKIVGLQNIVDIMKFTDIPLRFQIGLNMSMHLAEWVPFGDMFDLIKGELQSSKVEEDENNEKDEVLFVSKCEIGINDKYINYNKPLNGGIFIANAFNGNGKCPIRFTEKKCIHSNLMSYFDIKTQYKTKLNLKYIYYYLKSISKNIENTYGKGSCNQSLDVKNFNRMKIPIPPIEAQNQIVAEINEVEAIADRWKRDIEYLKNKKGNRMLDILNLDKLE